MTPLYSHFHSHALMMVECETINTNGRRAVYRHPMLARYEFSTWRNCSESEDIWTIWQDGDAARCENGFADVLLLLDCEPQEFLQ